MALPRLLRKSLPSIFDGRKKYEAGDPLMLDDNRPLSSQELELLTYLLNLSPTTQAFTAQLPFTTVTHRCKCGCPTVSLSVSAEGPATQASQRVIVDVKAAVRDKSVGILVFADEGKLSELEVYDLSGEIEAPFPLPSIESIGMWQRSSPTTSH